ncbi:MAG: DNA replication and repair protein RecF [bacterium]|nr:DNA replication and repair protein RecF [bacterium]
MTFLSLQLVQFRNHRKATYSFSPATTIVVGPNASGKTNLLEAIRLLSTASSFRGAEEATLVSWGKEHAQIRGEVLDGKETTRLTIHIQVDGDSGHTQKKLLVNNISRRTQDFIGHLPTVVFAPHELELVNGAPSLRRHYLDSILVQTNLAYKHALAEYEGGIRRRNKILERLQEGFGKRDELDFWDEHLGLHGTTLMEFRAKLFKFFVEQRNPMGIFFYTYIPSVKGISIKQRLVDTRERDIAAGMTLSGPQRDDFTFRFDGHDLALFGSRGEQRSAILNLKLLELRYLESVLDKKPLVLLDDIFSELDDAHRRLVFQAVSAHQSIITTTDERLVRRKRGLTMIELS